MKGDYKIKGGLKLKVDTFNTTIKEDRLSIKHLSESHNKKKSVLPDLGKSILISLVEDELYHLPNQILFNQLNFTTFYQGIETISMLDYVDEIVVLYDQNSESKDIQSLKDISKTKLELVKNLYPVTKAIASGLSKCKKLFETTLSPQEVMAFAQNSGKHYLLLAGNAFTEQIIIETQIGTPVSLLIASYLKPSLAKDIRADKDTDTNYILIKNSPLAGDLLTEDDEIALDMDCIIGLDKTPISRIKETACINCGSCSKVCPAGLIPTLLYKHMDKNIINEKVVYLQTMACIECGLCDYVCPSKLYLTDSIRSLKAELINQKLIDIQEVK